METKEKLKEMLTENTGQHMLDSGGVQNPDGTFKWGYGRNWQRNQGRDFDAEPAATVEFHVRGEDVDIMVTLSVYHWLCERLEYDPKMDELYRDWCEAKDEPLWLHSAEEFVKVREGRGIYGEGDPAVVNTYNGEDLLSQTIQFVYWTEQDEFGCYEPHILLQIHGGCDVRGGYTDPVAFTPDGMDGDGLDIFDNARATLFCPGCEYHWSTDDGYHWYPEGTCGNGYKQLETYTPTETEPDYSRWLDFAKAKSGDQKTFPGVSEYLTEPNSGFLWVDEDGKGHCPRCGEVLEVSGH